MRSVLARTLTALSDQDYEHARAPSLDSKSKNRGASE
jgi:hypothetical protein